MIKNLFSVAALLAAGAPLAVHAQAPAITNFMHEGDSCYYNSNPGHFSGVYGSVSNPTPNMNALVYWGDGSSSTVNVNSQGTAGSFWGGHNYNLAGVYTAMAVLRDAAGNSLDTATADISAFCHSLWGIIYKRNDANCTYDYPTDDYLSFNHQIEIRKNNIVIDTVTAWGSFYYNVPNPDPTAEYSLHPLGSIAGYQQVCPTPASVYKVRLDTLNAVNGRFDYGYECNPNTTFDLSVYMSGLLRFVNFSYLYINAHNSGCTAQNGTVTLNIDPQYSYSSANPAPASVSGQTVTWNASNLSGSNSQLISVALVPAGTLTPGDTSCHTVSITPVSGDANPGNNGYTFCDSIRASLDPNEKHVSGMGGLSASQELTYTINFENEGNDTAFNIYILDTLSTLLDASSFEILTSSHAVRPSFTDYNNTKIIRFDFRDILLADKNHPESNKGFVMYKAKARNNLQPGDEITNTAHIYFDINPAVVTNTVRSKIPDPTSISRLSPEDGISVYPNPAKNVLYLENKTGRFSQAMLVNSLGQVSLRQELRKGVNNLNTSALAAGTYYLVVSGSEAIRSLKVTLK